MKTYRTAAHWLGLLQQRSNFKGTNIEFYYQHNVAITAFYLILIYDVHQIRPILLSPEEYDTRNTKYVLILSIYVRWMIHIVAFALLIRVSGHVFKINLGTQYCKLILLLLI